MKKHSLILVLVLSVNAFAAPVTIQLDPNSGKVEFHATGHPSALKIVGKGKAPEGQLKEDAQGITGTTRFDLNSLETGVGMRDHHMKEKYLETTKYPQAELTVTELKFPRAIETGKAFSFDAVPFQGQLKLHGTEKPVSGTAHIESDGQRSFSTTAQWTIKLDDYGVTIPSFAGITVADEVQISVEAHGK